MGVTEKLYTVAEFEAIADAPENRDRRLQLINGELVEKIPTFWHGIAVANLIFALMLWNSQTKAGSVVSEVRYRLVADQYNARIPDISFYAGDQPMPVRGSAPYPSTLAVEVKSPDDTLRDLRERARYMLANGTSRVWLVNPEKRVVEVFGGKDDLLLSDDRLTDDELLPGFSIRVGDIFEDPMGRQEI